MDAGYGVGRRSHEPSAAERRRRNLIDARLDSPEAFSDAEFSEEKARLAGEISRLRIRIVAVQERERGAEQSVRNAVSFAASAQRAFESGEPGLRRRVASRLAEVYYLTLGKLEIKVHPLLVPMLTIGPDENGSDSPKGTHLTQASPSWSAIRDGIRTAAVEKYLSFPAWEADP